MNDEKFLPTPINKLDEILRYFIDSGPLARNVAYTLQYCQYLKHLYQHTSLTAVITSQLYKSYIICAMSIIEAVLYAILLKNNKIKNEEWEEYGNKKTENIDKCTKIEIQIYKKSQSPKPKKMKFISLLNKAINLEIFKSEEKLFDDIKDLNRLRNKVHIYDIHDFGNSDYNQFNQCDFDKMISTLNKFILILVKSYKIPMELIEHE